MTASTHEGPRTNDLRFDRLPVTVRSDGAEMAETAARWVAKSIAEAIDDRGEANLVLATGPSQEQFVSALLPHVEWGRVNLFHMDEYVGISDSHPASFRNWMTRCVLGSVRPRSWNPLNGDASDLDDEARRYEGLLTRMRPDVCVMGIGENAHIAFNDPPADFETQRYVHRVLLNETCKRQQVGEGHFHDIASVPGHALSLTVRGLLTARHVAVVVPEARKALAVRSALLTPVSPLCPASILRTAAHARLFLDSGSASLIDHHVQNELPDE